MPWGKNNDIRREPLANMRVGLFVTCLVDLMRPSRRLRRPCACWKPPGAEVVVPGGADLLRAAGVECGRSGPLAVALARKPLPNWKATITW
jgi:hypothetical protein